MARSFSDDQWFFGTIGIVDKEEWVLRPCVDKSLPSILQQCMSPQKPVYQLWPPRDVHMSFRGELARTHGRILPTFAEWVGQNKGFFIKYGLDFPCPLPGSYSGEDPVMPYLTHFNSAPEEQARWRRVSRRPAMLLPHAATLEEMAEEEGVQWNNIRKDEVDEMNGFDDVVEVHEDVEMDGEGNTSPSSYTAPKTGPRSLSSPEEQGVLPVAIPALGHRGIARTVHTVEEGRKRSSTSEKGPAAKRRMLASEVIVLDDDDEEVNVDSKPNLAPVEEHSAPPNSSGASLNRSLPAFPLPSTSMFPAIGAPPRTSTVQQFETNPQTTTTPQPGDPQHLRARDQITVRNEVSDRTASSATNAPTAIAALRLDLPDHGITMARPYGTGWEMQIYLGDHDLKVVLRKKD